jgi:putative nucleotidyltransferase with HDIG domain
VPLILRHRPWLLALMAAMATLPGAFVHMKGETPLEVSPVLHLILVASAAGTAAVASMWLSIIGVRMDDGRTVLLSTAFSTMTVTLAVHGLATPGVIFGPNGVVALAGAASLPLGGALLALTALPRLRRPLNARRLLKVQIAAAAAVAALGLTGMLIPSLVPSVPAAGTTPAYVLLAVGASFYLVLVHRALRTFALTQRARDLVVAVGCAWLGIALFPQLLTGYGTIGFYVGHAIELAGVALIAVSVVLDLARAGASRPLIGDLSAAEIVTAEENYLGARVRALMLSLARKDVSTEQHTRRVALLAVQVGEELRLPPADLRHLAVGGLLHDIGKLSVAEHILRKPGALTDEEFEEIKRHPGAGVELLHELGGFPDAVRRLVHEHHERLDGSGYPQALSGPGLGIGPRVMAVCDVFDALTSDRAYRQAWGIERALGLLRESAGSQFDAKCVHALEKVVLRTQEMTAREASVRAAFGAATTTA